MTTATSAGRLAPGELSCLSGRRILVTGATGMLGSALSDALERDAPGSQIVRPSFDVSDRDATLRAAETRPSVVIHCAALVNADLCEREPARCRRIIVEGTANVAELAAQSGAVLVLPQTFLVFDGACAPITEEGRPAPLSEYGRAKLDAEELVRARLPESMVVRMGGFFGGEHRDKNFVGAFARSLPRLLSAKTGTYAVGDRVWQPTYTRDLAENLLLLVARRKSGVYHMASHGEATFHEVACAVVTALGLDGSLRIERRSAAESARHDVAPRPERAVLDNARLRREGLDRQRPWREALTEYLARPYFRRLVEDRAGQGGTGAD